MRNILALGQALNAYAKGIATLAADSSSDEKAFAKSLSDLATNVGGLDGAIAKASNGTGLPQAQLNAVATIISQAGNLYFEFRRVAVLRRIIIASDPFVQQATAVLSATGDPLRLAIMNGALQDVRNASFALDDAISKDASVSEIKTKQAAVFAAMDNYKQRAGTSDAFAKIGAAHADLARAAKAGASGPDLQAAIFRLADAGKAIKQSVDVLQEGQ